MRKLAIFIYCLHSFSAFGVDANVVKDVTEAKDAVKLAAEKLTGGIMQLDADKQLENNLAEVELIKKCKKEVSADIANLTPDKLNFDELAKVYPSCQSVQASLTPDKIKTFFSDKNAIKFYNVDGTRLQGDRSHNELKKYLSERMEKAIYGNQKEDKIAKGFANHKVFYELYRKQIGKSFLLNVSEFCQDYFKNQKAYSAQDEEDANKKLTANFDLKDESEQYKLCLASLPCQCYSADNELKAKMCVLEDKDGNQQTLTAIANKEVTQMACTLVARLRQMKQELAYLNSVEEGFAKLSGNSASAGMTVYDGTAKDKSIDDLTELTSKEYEDHVAVNKEEVKDKCKGIEDGSQTKSNENCQIGEVSAETLASMQVEQSLKAKMMEEELKSINDNDKEALKEYFKKRDLLTAQLEKEIEASAAEVKKQAMNKLKIERENIIANINKQINESTIVVNENKEIQNTNKTSEVAKKAETQVDRMKRLIHFTNLVSGYFEDDKNKHYTRTLEREISSDGAASDFVKNKDYFKQLSNSAESQLKDNTSDSSGLFSIGEINKLLHEDK